MGYERNNISRLAAYTPGEQPQRVPGKRMVKLNTNENPYPPAPAVLEAIRSVDADMLRRYPPPLASRFRETAARVHGLQPDQVIATNGGDELIRLAITVFCHPLGRNLGTRVDGDCKGRYEETFRGDSERATFEASQGRTSGGSGVTSGGGGSTFGGLGIAEPSYSLYPVQAQIHDTPITRVLLREDFSLPDDFAPIMLDAGCRLVMVVNPHAPSGRLEPIEKLEGIARALMGRCVLLIDEAYVDFATHNALSLLEPAKGLDNVLLLRSFSKGYSLAGLRFGYGLGHRDLIAALDKARDSYNTDILSQTAAIAALENRHQAAKSWQAVIQERQRMTQELVRRGFKVLPSQSNFILATPPEPPEVPPEVSLGNVSFPEALEASPKVSPVAQQEPLEVALGNPPALEAQKDQSVVTGSPRAHNLYLLLKKQEIYVRYFDLDGLRDRLRITIGTPEENQALLTALDEIGSSGSLSPGSGPPGSQSPGSQTDPGNDRKAPQSFGQTQRV